MNWNEKIDAIKQRFSKETFSVPMVGRKHILRQIETHFISRPVDYYASNEFTGIFKHWWAHLKPSTTSIIPRDQQTWNEIGVLLDDEKGYWIAVEFDEQVLVYQASKPALITLMEIGQTWSSIYHVIDLKYERMKSFHFEAEEVIIKHQAIVTAHSP